MIIESDLFTQIRLYRDILISNSGFLSGKKAANKAEVIYLLNKETKNKLFISLKPFSS